MRLIIIMVGRGLDGNSSNSKFGNENSNSVPIETTFTVLL